MPCRHGQVDDDRQFDRIHPLRLVVHPVRRLSVADIQALQEKRPHTPGIFGPCVDLFPCHEKLQEHAEPLQDRVGGF